MEKRFNHVDNELSEGKSSEDSADKDGKLSPDQQMRAAPAEASDSAIEKLQAQIAEKDKEISELKDRYLRTLAESENARKRIRQQSDETVRVQRENFLRELLPVIDNLERAVEAARGGGNGKSIVEGVEMVLRSMLDFLKTHGVTQLTSVGQQFDPQLHEAIDQIEGTGHPPNTVVNEFKRGYQIGDRLLRPAGVVVAKGTQSGSNGGNGSGTAGNDVETD